MYGSVSEVSEWDGGMRSDYVAQPPSPDPHLLHAESGDFDEHIDLLRRRRSRGMRKVVHLAVGFCFQFAAYNTIQNYVTTLLPGSLGFTSLCVLYVAVCPSLLLAPAVCARLGDRCTLVVGSLCYAVWILSLLRPNQEWLVLLASAVIGFGAAILWVAQGSYLTSFGDTTNRDVLAGTFWGIYQCSGVLGNLAAYLVLSKFQGGDSGSHAPLFIGGLALSLVAAVGFGFLSPLQKDARWEQDEREGSLLGGRPIHSSTAGIAFTRLDGTYSEVSSAATVVSPTFAPCQSLSHEWEQIQMKKGEFLCLAPLLFLTGYEMGFVAGEFPKIFAPNNAEHPIKQSSISLVFLAWAFAEVLGSYSVGKVAHVVGKRTTLMLGGTIFVVALCITWALQTDHLVGEAWEGVSVWAFAAAVAFGIADCVFNVIVLSKLGDMYPQQGSHGAFTLYQFLQNAGSAIAFLLPVLFCEDEKKDGCEEFTSWYIASQGLILLISMIGFCMLGR